jgi:hypothetical protein
MVKRQRLKRDNLMEAIGLVKKKKSFEKAKVKKRLMGE